MSDFKSILRHAMLKIRNSAPSEVLDRFSETIQERVMHMDAFNDARTVAAYYSINSEVRTNTILNQILERGKNLALPRIIDDSTMVFSIVSDLENDLEMGKHDIPAPKNHCRQTEELDLVVVPGIVWDEKGHRIGYGKGYYDRYLSKLDTVTVGLAYDFQVFYDVPFGPNDFTVDSIITEKRIINIR